jgi:hypothetical protein
MLSLRCAAQPLEAALCPATTSSAIDNKQKSTTLLVMLVLCCLLVSHASKLACAAGPHACMCVNHSQSARAAAAAGVCRTHACAPVILKAHVLLLLL